MTPDSQAALPLVSIVVPTYNRANFIEQTIDSLLSQDYAPLEIIVVNDGSTDNTSEILAKYSGLQIITQPNQGQCAALDRGWMSSRGKYIGYLSSDDLLTRDAVSRIVAVLERDDAIGCCFPDADLIDGFGQTIRRSICKPFVLEESVVHQTWQIGPGAIFRREIFEVIGGWNSAYKLAPDGDYWLRLARHGRIEMLQERLAYYRLHRGSISYRETSESASLEYIRLLDEYFAQSDVPSSIALRKNEAYGNAYFTVAVNCMRNGEIVKGLKYYKKSCSLNRRMMAPANVVTLVRRVISKQVRLLLATFKHLAGKSA